MRRFIENHTGFCILAATLLGFVVPGLSLVPSWFLLVIIAAVIYVSCYNIKAVDFKAVSLKSILQFYILRYILLPLTAFYVLSTFSVQLAIAVTLLFLLPAGVSSPALCGIYGGNVTLGFVLCVLTHLACPVLIPLICFFTIGTHLALDLKSLFVTLLITIVCPMLLYYVTRGVSISKRFFVQNNKLLSIILISSIGFFMIGIQRDLFLEKLPAVPLLILYSSIALFIQFAFSWLSEKNEEYRERITYTVASLFNNTALGLGIALIYFPGTTALFILVAEVPWCIAPTFFSMFLKRRRQA